MGDEFSLNKRILSIILLLNNAAGHEVLAIEKIAYPFPNNLYDFEVYSCFSTL